MSDRVSANTDDQVDAQPLLVPNQTVVINGASSKHDVLYVVTESNTVYAIDASTGDILLNRNLGAPVPSPFGCHDNPPNLGITATPVIDLAKKTLYVIAYVSDSNGGPPTYRLHALKLSDLADQPNSPVTVTASHQLVNGDVVTFDAKYHRLRAGLIELNGNVYAGFKSFCDFNAFLTRGWILGWNAQTLAPLSANHLTNRLNTSPSGFFLSTIWMSGYGIAGAGNELFFSTGNSDPNGPTYDGVTNIQESAVRLKGNLTQLLGVFTPPDWFALDQADRDFGAGGVLLLPKQRGKFPYLAATAGKDGRLFLLNRKDMSTPLDEQPTDPERCLCGPSYFKGPDGIGRIVTSHGRRGIGYLHTWKLLLSPNPHLEKEGSGEIVSGQAPGFFTAISSNGTKAGSAIIWALGRAVDPATTFVHLFAFAAAPDGTLNLLFTSAAGNWPNQGSAFLAPVVANGRVYVASAILDDTGKTRGQLTIFGLLGPKAPQVALKPSPVAPVTGSLRVVSGTLLNVDGATLTLETRTGKTVKIDASQALQNKRVTRPLSVGTPFTVQGSSLTATGALIAASITRAKGAAAEGLWPPDR